MKKPLTIFPGAYRDMQLETPYPYQQEGAEWLAGKENALIADEMGLGKSCQAIVAADKTGARNILVVCRANMSINWAREFQRFSPLDHDTQVVLEGKQKIISPVVILSYSLVINPKVLAQLMAREWDVLILDEAHALKERNAKCTKAIYGSNAKHCGIRGRAARCWRLTGTPAPNNASELWTHLRSGGITDLTYWDFVFRYCSGFDSQFGHTITGHKNVDELKTALAPFMLRRKKEDVMKDLPPISYHEVTVEKSPVDIELHFIDHLRIKSQAQFLDDIKVSDTTLRMALKAIDDRVKGNVPAKLAVLEGLQPAQTTLRRYVGMAKVPKIAEILLGELASGEIDKLVIFAVHQCVIEALRLEFRKFGPVTLYGGTPAEKRQSNVDKFMNDPKCRVFIGNIQAAGTGITLTSACEVAFVEPSWVPADNMQAAMRCHRIGQERKVRVRVFSLAGSSDEDVIRTLLRKQRELQKIM